MGEKIYKTVENSGVMNVVAGACDCCGSVCSGERDTASDYSEKAAFLRGLPDEKI